VVQQDLAHFIGRGIRHSNDAGVVTGLVDHYLTNLLAGGVQDYDADQLLFDFRLGLHVPFHIMVFQVSRINPEIGIENTAILKMKDLYECVDALEALKALWYVRFGRCQELHASPTTHGRRSFAITK
jgi:hypothetical protein